MIAYNIDEMPRVDLGTMVHGLNIRAECKLVKQKKKSFTLERQEAIKEEIHKLTQVGFINEVMYPEWLANVVLV